jgi:hypothetical protein
MLAHSLTSKALCVRGNISKGLEALDGGRSKWLNASRFPLGPRREFELGPRLWRTWRTPNLESELGRTPHLRRLNTTVYRA